MIKALFLEIKVSVTFWARKAALCLPRLYSRSKFNNFEHNKMKLSVNKTQLTGLWAWNCATIQQVWILKFALGPEKFPGLPRNGPQELTVSCIVNQFARGSFRICRFLGSCIREYDLIQLTQGSKHNCLERGLHVNRLDLPLLGFGRERI